jgi:uncharacterized protein YbjT (DUF2867 family)
VISTANSAGRGGEDNPQSVDLEGNRNLIEAARDAGVEHFIFVSAFGADPDHPDPFMQAKGQSEASLRESGMEYTILGSHAIHGNLGRDGGRHARLARPTGYLGR